MRRARELSASRGFTLLELLVVIAILSLLMSILLSTLSKVHRTATSVLCQTKLRAVSQRFTEFADDYCPTDRGDSKRLGPTRFRLDDFQESLYKVDEFWDLDEEPTQVASYDRSKQLLMCPAGRGNLSRRGFVNLDDGAVFPTESVTLGFNMRLCKANRLIGDRWDVTHVTLTSHVLDHPLVPLVFDVDGEEAGARMQLPFYAAPVMNGQGTCGGDSCWFPSKRHDGKVQAAFVGGHVATSVDPASEPGWDWRYEPSFAESGEAPPES
ncbi:MAG: prepilin-type N-terminal cleavage/methylation domain-containing protein [Phycisphaerae bacterium]|nr:prepilin-type N-terminal cleavage/methylation domain-containing protein [Phycisphaerae bacterium]